MQSMQRGVTPPPPHTHTHAIVIVTLLLLNTHHSKQVLHRWLRDYDANLPGFYLRSRDFAQRHRRHTPLGRLVVESPNTTDNGEAKEPEYTAVNTTFLFVQQW